MHSGELRLVEYRHLKAENEVFQQVLVSKLKDFASRLTKPTSFGDGNNFAANGVLVYLFIVGKLLSLMTSSDSIDFRNFLHDRVDKFESNLVAYKLPAFEAAILANTLQLNLSYLLIMFNSLNSHVGFA